MTIPRAIRHKQTTSIAYSTGKPPQQPPQPQPRSSSSSSVAIATGAPTPLPTPTSTTHITSTSTTTTTSTRGNNSQNCCTGWTCCGITSIVLFSIFICCILPFIIVAIAIGSAASNIPGMVDYNNDDQYYGLYNNNGN